MTNATTIRTSTIVTSSHYAELPDGSTIDLPYEADDIVDPFLSEDGNLFRYAVRDDDCREYDWQEGVEFIQGNPHSINYAGAEEAERWIEEMSVDHDLFSVDVYEHGNIMYSLSGTGPQCQFDTARGGACIAIPNEHHESPFTNTEEAAASILSEYTSWCNGDVYGIVEITRDPETGAWAEDDMACWGVIGYEYAEQCCREGV